MKKLIKKLLNKISKIFYFTTPAESRYGYIDHHLILQKNIYKNLADETFDHFKDHFKKSLLFVDSWKQRGLKTREYAIKKALTNDKNKEYFYLEFGVYKGVTANFFSKYLDKLYAFDSFEGLEEDWSGMNVSKGGFNLDGTLPKLNSNIEPVVGWVEDTLEDFLTKHNPKINFVHFDMDTYTPTKFTLEKIKPYLVKGSILIFDELYNYVGWEYGEYKALNDVFKENEFKYKAFNLNGRQVVVEIE